VSLERSKFAGAEREAKLDAVEAESREAVRPYEQDGVLAAPSRANLLTARVRR
jgi:hypothetical protein